MKKSVKSFIRASYAIHHDFLKHMGFEPIWHEDNPHEDFVGHDIPTIFCAGDYYFNINDCAEILYYDIPKRHVFDHYEHDLACHYDEKLPRINLKNWSEIAKNMGEEYTPEKMLEHLKEQQKRSQSPESKKELRNIISGLKKQFKKDIEPYLPKVK